MGLQGSSCRDRWHRAYHKVTSTDQHPTKMGTRRACCTGGRGFRAEKWARNGRNYVDVAVPRALLAVPSWRGRSCRRGAQGPRLVCRLRGGGAAAADRGSTWQRPTARQDNGDRHPALVSARDAARNGRARRCERTRGREERGAEKKMKMAPSVFKGAHISE